MNNKSLASDVVIFLDAVKERIIQGVMRINLNDVKNLTIPRPPEEEESAEEKAMNGLVIMNNTTKAGYTALRKFLIENDKYDAESLPSCFKICKELRPNVDEYLVQPESIFISERRLVVKRKRKSEVLKGEEVDCKQNSLNRSYYLNQLRKDTKCNEAESTVKDDNHSVIVAKISGTYRTYMNILAEKQKLRMKGIDNCV